MSIFTLSRNTNTKSAFSRFLPGRYEMKTNTAEAQHKRRRPFRHFVHEHSLSLTATGMLLVWIALYLGADPATHLGSFYGNAIADWSGSVVIILGTKFLIEVGSAESKVYHGHIKNPIGNFMMRHSLLLFLILTGIGWAILY